jgi:hypothetical protein
VTGDLVKVAAPIEPAGQVAKGAAGYLLDGRLNESFKAVNLLLDGRVPVRRVGGSAASATRPGDFLVPASAPEKLIADVARRTGVDFAALASDVQGAQEVKRLRIGMYQRYYGGNMDEGWTRWLLEQYGFPYTTLMDKEIKAGGLEAAFDVIILPADSTAAMTGEREPGEGGGRGGGFGTTPASYPPEYRSGLGKEGVEALQAFVQKGGTLLTFGEAGDLAISRLRLPLRNVVAGLKPTEFWCPGSTLKVKVDSTHPLAHGMPAQALAVFMAGSQAYEIVPSDHNERVDTIVTFVDRDLLQSGWLLGESTLAKKAAMVSVEHGQGTVVLIGFRPQHRAQTHGTFKLVFDSLLGGSQPRREAPTNSVQ